MANENRDGTIISSIDFSRYWCLSDDRVRSLPVSLDVLNAAIMSVSEATTQPGVISLDKKVIAQTFERSFTFEGAVEGTLVTGMFTVRSVEFPELKPGQLISLVVRKPEPIEQ